MSQRVFHYKDKVVTTGWDSPLQYHFLVVERKPVAPREQDSEEEDIIYSNLDDEECPQGRMTIESICRKLKEMGIPWPIALTQDLYNDMMQNTGNLVHVYRDWMVQ